MQSYTAKSLTLLVLVGALLQSAATAQTFRQLYSFSSSPIGHGTNADGALPYGPLVFVNNSLYGIATDGGTGGYGTVFRLNGDGTGFINLHSFSPLAGPQLTNDDGANPGIGLVLSGTRLYGTTDSGGPGGSGTIFSMDLSGSGFKVLHAFSATSPRPFTNSDGAYPFAWLTIAGNTLYGTAEIGGASGNGTIFSISTDGSGFALLHTFSAGTGASRSITNVDGAYPFGGLVLAGDTLYGTAGSGGSSAKGTVFALGTNGSGFVTLHEFSPLSGSPLTNSDGASPNAGLALAGGTLYGNTGSGGVSGNGVLFSVRTDGSGFTNLHSFSPTSGSAQTNVDGAYPTGVLVVGGNTLYGTADSGGTSGTGIIFAMDAQGGGFRTLYSFTGYTAPDYTNSDGGNPDSGVSLVGNTLYGAASSGGVGGRGTVFAISLPSAVLPALTITPASTGIELMWPASAGGFNLESSTNLGFPTVWSPVSVVPAVINEQNVVTNPASGTARFFRLRQ